MTSFLKRYFVGNKKITSSSDDERLKRLQELTRALTQEMDPPEHTIMDAVMEFSDRGVIGFDKDGTILFSNTSSYMITNLRDCKGKCIFDIIDKQSSENLRNFVDGSEKSSSLKIEVDNGINRRYYDVGVFRISNGKVWFVIFCIDCLERALYERENCPLRGNCPFNKRCVAQEAEVKA